MNKDARTIYNTPLEEIKRIMAENADIVEKYRSRQIERECPICEQLFILGRKDQKFCSDTCRSTWFKIKTEVTKRLLDEVKAKKE